MNAGRWSGHQEKCHGQEAEILTGGIKDVEREMHKFKRGQLKSGPGGRAAGEEPQASDSDRALGGPPGGKKVPPPR